MPISPFKPRPPASLWKATEDLIAAVGGYDRASEIAGLGRGTLGRYADPDEPERSITAQAIRRLERESGDPIVTRYLAAEAGAALLTLELPPDRDHVAAEVARLAASASRVFDDGAKALADGKVSPGEAAALIADLDALLVAAMQLRGHLMHLRDGGEK